MAKKDNTVSDSQIADLDWQRIVTNAPVSPNPPAREVTYEGDLGTGYVAPVTFLTLTTPEGKYPACFDVKVAHPAGRYGEDSCTDIHTIWINNENAVKLISSSLLGRDVLCGIEHYAHFQTNKKGEGRYVYKLNEHGTHEYTLHVIRIGDAWEHVTND